jgi:hypothetical protein
VRPGLIILSFIGQACVWAWIFLEFELKCA